MHEGASLNERESSIPAGALEADRFRVLPSRQRQLKLYWHAGRGDNYSASTPSGEANARRGGYRFVRIQGSVYPQSGPATKPLWLFYHSGRGDNFSASTSRGEAAAKGAGYRFVRIQGYVLCN